MTLPMPRSGSSVEKCRIITLSSNLLRAPEQKTLRQLNEAKQQQIKRMQAMRKRLKKGSQKPER